MKAAKSIVNTEDIKVPPVVYKYRTWESEKHKTLITKRTVFMARPSSFEDEKEFRNYKRYDLMNDQEVYNKYLELSIIHNPGHTLDYHSNYAMEWTQRAPFRDELYLKEAQEKHFREYDDRIGVLSLSLYNDNLSMWNYYSCKGNGLCVGLNTKKLFPLMGEGGPVNYPYDGVPIINVTDSFDIQTWKQVYNKEVKWAFEKEYRFTVFDKTGLTDYNRGIVLPAECFEEVIFGWAMPRNVKTSIINACDVSGLKVAFFEASINGDIVSINYIRIR